MLAPVVLGFYGSCRKMAKIFPSSSGMMEVGAGGHFRCRNSAEDALRNWNLSRWYWHLPLWHFPVTAGQLLHSTCWTVEKNHSSLKAILNDRQGKTSRPGLKPEICRMYQQAHNISDWWEIRWGLQLVCWPVSSCWRRGESVCLAGLIFLFFIPR